MAGYVRPSHLSSATGYHRSIVWIYSLRPVPGSSAFATGEAVNECEPCAKRTIANLTGWRFGWRHLLDFEVRGIFVALHAAEIVGRHLATVLAVGKTPVETHLTRVVGMLVALFKGATGGEKVYRRYTRYTLAAFEFDALKSVANKAKHGIDFVEAQAL